MFYQNLKNIIIIIFHHRQDGIKKLSHCAAEAVFLATHQRIAIIKGLNNIKKSAVSRGENTSKKTGQMSYKYGEIIKKTDFCVWGKARQRASQANPHPTNPHPTASRIRGVYTWRERDFITRTWNPDAELRRGEKGRGEKITQNLITQ
jgi:hypothetical protein